MGSHVLVLHSREAQAFASPAHAERRFNVRVVKALAVLPFFARIALPKTSETSYGIGRLNASAGWKGLAICTLNLARTDALHAMAPVLGLRGNATQYQHQNCQSYFFHETPF